MKLYYDKNVDYLEVFFQDVHIEPNYGSPFGENGIVVFQSEKDDRVLGYAFENASVQANKSRLLGVVLEFNGDKVKVRD